MGRGTQAGPKASTPTPALLGAAVDLPPDDPEFEALEALDALTDEIGGNVGQYTVVVFKRTADGNRISRCKRIPLAEFDADKLPAMFGAGEYKLRILDGDRKLARELRVFFDPTIFPVVPTPAPAGAPSAVATPAALAGPSDYTTANVADVRALLLEQAQSHNRFLETLLAKGAASGPTLQDQIAMIKAVIDLVGPGARPAPTPAKEIADAMRLAIELADERGGGGGGKPSILERVIDQLGPALVEMIRRAPGAPGVPRPRLAPAPGGTPASAFIPPAGILPAAGSPAAPPAPQAGAAPPPAAPPEADVSTLSPEWAEYAFLRKWTDRAKDLAAANVAADLVASMLYQAIPDQHLETLERFVSLPDPERAALLEALDPTLGPFMLYLHAVARQVKAEIDADAVAETVPGETGGPGA